MARRNKQVETEQTAKTSEVTEEVQETVQVPETTEETQETAQVPEVTEKTQEVENKEKTEESQEAQEATDKFDEIMKLHSDMEELIINSRGFVFTPGTPKSMHDDGILYKNKYFK